MLLAPELLLFSPVHLTSHRLLLAESEKESYLIYLVLLSVWIVLGFQIQYASSMVTDVTKTGDW